ncbi:MAG TPA: hypothetical protein VME46_22910 [Acidimicrobiales bacterium]|nr:hypothetical protein [Acidimicrobiales bacterium]
MANVGTADKLQGWGGRLGRIAMVTAAIFAGLSGGASTTSVAAVPATSATRSACSLLTHAQVVVLIDATHFSETISAPAHCSWDVAGAAATSNGVQLEIQKVTSANTLVRGPSPEVKDGCAGYVTKHFVESGVIGYYCIYAMAISGGQMFAQENKVQIWIPINYGLPGDTVKVGALIADAVHVIKEIDA